MRYFIREMFSHNHTLPPDSYSEKGRNIWALNCSQARSTSGACKAQGDKERINSYVNNGITL